MPAMDDDDRPKKKIVHEIGQDLTLLSVRELQETDRASQRGDRAPGGGHCEEAELAQRGGPVLQEIASPARRQNPGALR